MPKTVLNWFGMAIFISALMFFAGCGGSESGIESEEEVIAVELRAYDNGDPEKDEGTHTIDILQSWCGTPDDTNDDTNDDTDNDTDNDSANEDTVANTEKLTPEPYFDTLGKATFHYMFYCPTCPAGADETYIVDSYSVEYIPLKSPDSEGGYFFPPQLVNLDNRPIVNQMVLSREFTVAERSFILISVNTKSEFREKSSLQGTPIIGAFYDVRVTFHCRNRAGGMFTTTSDLQLTFGPYDNCDND